MDARRRRCVRAWLFAVVCVDALLKLRGRFEEKEDGDEIGKATHVVAHAQITLVVDRQRLKMSCWRMENLGHLHHQTCAIVAWYLHLTL